MHGQNHIKSVLFIYLDITVVIIINTIVTVITIRMW